MNTLYDTLTAPLQVSPAIIKQDVGVLRITGVDAKKFLQGQTTCDIQKLSETQGVYGAICSIKGRIISNFYLLQYNEDLLMIMNEELIEKTLLHLKKYAVFFKAELTNVNDLFQVQTEITISEASQLDSLSETVPVKKVDPHSIKATICDFPLIVNLHISTQKEPVIKYTTELAALTLLSARPLITLEQSEKILPQWLNMQRTGGISFKKGCYTGQEIVARMQYRGKSKKQLALFQWFEKLDENKEILNDEGQSIGQILDCQPLKNGYLAQAIINIEPHETKNFNLDGKTITHLRLPYKLED